MALFIAEGVWWVQAKRDAETAAELEKESLDRKEGRSCRRDGEHSRRSRSPVKDRDRKSRCPCRI